MQEAGAALPAVSMAPKRENAHKEPLRNQTSSLPIVLVPGLMELAEVKPWACFHTAGLCHTARPCPGPFDQPIAGQPLFVQSQSLPDTTAGFLGSG